MRDEINMSIRISRAICRDYAYSRTKNKQYRGSHFENGKMVKIPDSMYKKLDGKLGDWQASTKSLPSFDVQPAKCKKGIGGLSRGLFRVGIEIIRLLILLGREK